MITGVFDPFLHFCLGSHSRFCFAKFVKECPWHIAILSKSPVHCMKSVQIRSYFWSVFSCIQSEYRKIRTRNNSVFGHFSCSGQQAETVLKLYFHHRNFPENVQTKNAKQLPAKQHFGLFFNQSLSLQRLKKRKFHFVFHFEVATGSSNTLNISTFATFFSSFSQVFFLVFDKLVVFHFNCGIKDPFHLVLSHPLYSLE